MYKMEWKRLFLIFALTTVMPMFPDAQHLEFTPEQIQSANDSLYAYYNNGKTGNFTQEEVKNIFSLLVNDPVIRWIMEQYGLADIQNVQGHSFLIAGAKFGNINVTKSALEMGAYINLRDENGCTALHWATSENQTDVALFLINMGASVNIQNFNHGDTAMGWSANNNNVKIAKALVYNGADVNLTNFKKDTPIKIGASMGSGAVVNFLIENGADVNLPNSEGLTPLMMASYYNFSTIVRSLLAASADPDLRSLHGDTALIQAGHHGFNSIVRELIVSRADLNLENNLGVTPLLIAAKMNRSEVVRLLLSAGADIDRQAKDGDTALMEAVNLGFIDVVRVFLEHCPNLGLFNNNRKPVHYIAFIRQLPEIQNMLAAHANLTCSNDHGVVYHVGESRFDACREIQCCHGVWSPTGRTLSTCGAECRRTLAPVGVCTVISNCPQLEQQLREKLSTSNDSMQIGAEFVSSYGCGVNGDQDVQVCCPTA